MAVHLPLGPEAILEAQLLMLASHNILNPQMVRQLLCLLMVVLGLYYMTKERLSTPEKKILGQDLTSIQLKRLILLERRRKIRIKC
jgi:DNA-directed RNA polymerase subunit beta'